jgi:hypothetical protein
MSRRSCRARALSRLATVMMLVMGVAAFAAMPVTANGRAPAVAAGPGPVATRSGVVWSTSASEDRSEVLRSVDGGRSSHVALSVPSSPNLGGISATYFLGPQDAWAVDQRLHGDGRGETTVVYRSVDGGGHWQRSLPLPDDLTECCVFPSDQIYFSSPRDGWVLAVGIGGNDLPGLLTMLWWRSTDGGRSWVRMSSNALPLEGFELVGAQGSCPTLSPPHLAFANAADGWFTEGSCGRGPAEPVVWRTTDGGAHWVPVALPGPEGGWGVWATVDHGGTDVGAAYRLAAPGGGAPTLLVPVSVGRSRLVIERSSDGGVTWQIAGTVDTLALPAQATPAGWFYPLDADRWVVAAPAGIYRTVDGGRIWNLVRSYTSLDGDTGISFVSLERGYLGGIRTTDGGRHWSPDGRPPYSAPDSSANGGRAVSTVELVGPDLAVAAGAEGLSTSTDSGRTWVRRLGPAAEISQVDFVNAKLGFALGSELVRTVDGGASWHALHQPLGGGLAQMSFWSATDGAGTVSDGGGDSIVVTNDAGARWRSLPSPPGWTMTNGSLVSPQGPGTACFTSEGVWVAAIHGDQSGVLFSADLGRTWRVALPPVDIPESATDNAALISTGIAGCSGSSDVWVLVGQVDLAGAPHSGGVYDLLRTVDGGRTWVDVLSSAAPDTGGPRPARPAVSMPTGGPPVAPPAGGSLSIVTPSVSTAWFIDINQDFGAAAVGSTDNGGSSWRIRATTIEQAEKVSTPRLPFDLLGDRLLAITALNDHEAWILFNGSKQNDRSFLSVTTDAGARWHRAATFG